MSGASTGRRAPLLGLATLLVQDPTPSWAWVLVLTSTAGAILHLLALRRARRTYWLVTLGAAGVLWNVPVLVVRRWRRFFPQLDRVVLATPAEASFARRAASRPIGRSIMPSRVAATPRGFMPTRGCASLAIDPQSLDARIPVGLGEFCSTVAERKV